MPFLLYFSLKMRQEALILAQLIVPRSANECATNPAFKRIHKQGMQRELLPADFVRTQSIVPVHAPTSADDGRLTSRAEPAKSLPGCLRLVAKCKFAQFTLT